MHACLEMNLFEGQPHIHQHLVLLTKSIHDQPQIRGTGILDTNDCTTKNHYDNTQRCESIQMICCLGPGPIKTLQRWQSKGMHLRTQGLCFDMFHTRRQGLIWSSGRSPAWRGAMEICNVGSEKRLQQHRLSIGCCDIQLNKLNTGIST